MMYSDWVRALFIHYEVDPASLAPFVPFEIDVCDGRAYVSLVAFYLRNLRPRLGGAVAACLSRPVANHGFLNVRTYVKHRGESGIYFLAEWLPNALSVFIGPRTFGLPYRYGRLDYKHDHESGDVSGAVVGSAVRTDADTSGDTVGSAQRTLRYRATVDPAACFEPCEGGTLTEFLLERYSAFTERHGVRRRFRVWHEPWPRTPVEAVVEEASLIALTGAWFDGARMMGADYSPGVTGIHMGRPQCINGEHCERGWRK
jgi:uncharacterized protein YqjF (DUF2071 family)